MSAGDWKVRGGVHHPVSPTCGIQNEDGEWIAKLHPLNGTPEDAEEVLERAYLMRGAPDMRAALEKIASGTCSLLARGTAKSCASWGYVNLCDPCIAREAIEKTRKPERKGATR